MFGTWQGIAYITVGSISTGRVLCPDDDILVGGGCLVMDENVVLNLNDGDGVGGGCIRFVCEIRQDDG